MTEIRLVHKGSVLRHVVIETGVSQDNESTNHNSQQDAEEYIARRMQAGCKPEQFIYKEIVEEEFVVQIEDCRTCGAFSEPDDYCRRCDKYPRKLEMKGWRY